MSISLNKKNIMVSQKDSISEVLNYNYNSSPLPVSIRGQSIV